MTPLRRYWFEFVIGLDEPCPRGAPEGVGVTARDAADALDLVRSRVFADVPLPAIRRTIEDVTTTSLCPWMVLPNMHDWSERGIWFPIGHERARGAPSQRFTIGPAGDVR